MRQFQYELRDGQCDEWGHVEADSLDEAEQEVISEAHEWVRGGDWGTDGALIEVYYTVWDGEDSDTAEAWIEGSTSVDIEPDHATLIRKAARWKADVGCGDSPDDHDWTSEGEGGCDDNPGVWSTGGTSMVFYSHCRECGLRRVERTTGSQKNHGEHDTVSYEFPDEDSDE